MLTTTLKRTRKQSSGWTIPRLKLPKQAPRESVADELLWYAALRRESHRVRSSLSRFLDRQHNRACDELTPTIDTMLALFDVRSQVQQEAVVIGLAIAAQTCAAL